MDAAPAPGPSLTRMLARQVPPATRAKGAEYHADRAVTDLTGSAVEARAIVRGTHPYHVHIRRKGNTFGASCECPYFVDRGVICKHIWATLIEAEAHGLLAGHAGAPAAGVARLRTAVADPDPIRLEAETAESDPEFDTPRESARRAEKERKGSPRQWEQFLKEFSAKLARDEAEARAPRFTDAQLVYVIDRGASMAGQSLALDLMARQRTKQGKWSKPKPAGVSTRDVDALADPADREIVPMLLGASD